MFEESEDYHSAAKYYQKVILRDKKNTKAYLGLADALYGIAIKRSIDVDFIEKDWLNAARSLEVAVELPDKNVSVRKKNLGNTYKVLSSIYLKEENYPKAEDYALKAKEYLTNEAEIYFNLGFLKYKDNQIDSAIEYYNQALKINQNLYEVKVNLALLYKEQNQFSESEKILKTALNSDTNNYSPELLLTEIYLINNEIAKAKDIIKLVKVENIKNNLLKSNYYNYLGIIDLEEKNEINAFENFKQAIRYNFWNYKARVNAAKIFYNRGEYQIALLELKTSLEQKPDDIEIINFMALSYIGLNDYKNAEQILVRAFKLSPKNPDVLKNLIYLYGECLKDEVKTELYKMILDDLKNRKN